MVPIEREQDPARKAERLHDLLKEHNVETQVVEIPGNTVFPHAMIFPHSYKGGDPLVRVYRGINQLDETILNQVPYALRSRERDAASLTVLDHARQEVDAVTRDPTYKNLCKYVDTVWPDLTDKEVGELSTELQRIEDEVLAGGSLRNSLLHRTYRYNGGRYADTGIAPYISASTNIREASGYGAEGLMIIDVPLSKLEALSARVDGEVAIKAGIPVEYITAVLPKKFNLHIDGEVVTGNVEAALAKIAPEVRHTVLSTAQFSERFRDIRDSEADIDALRHEADKAGILERRTRLLWERFPDARPTQDDVARIREYEGVNEYVALQRAIFDALATRMDAVGVDREVLATYEYSRDYDWHTGRSIRVMYERAVVTDSMLEALRKFVRRQEERHEARRRRLEDELRAKQLRDDLDHKAV